MPSCDVACQLAKRLVAASMGVLAAAALLYAPAAAGAKLRDSDRDGLSNRYERLRSHTNPRRSDTDGDRLRDRFELRISATNPRKKDTDGDGLTDSAERRLGTNPRVFDTDGDGAGDGLEVLLGTDPLTPDPPLPPPPPPPDTTAPETTITSGPSGTSASGSASFTFSSSEPSSSFECQLDSGAWAACSSPRDYTNLANGTHNFAVRATDAARNTDTSPATRSWTVNVPPPPPGPLAYTLPADRSYDWNPGLNAVGGIPAWTTIHRTISPSGGDDTAAIQSALDSCPANGVVQLTAGVFHITGQGLSIGRSNCVLRGSGTGPGNWPIGTAASGTAGTYLVKPTGTSYPVVIIGPRWGGSGTATNLTSDAVRGTNTATVASPAGLAVGDLVVVNSTTNSNISHWNSQDPQNNSGWFEQPNRPLGDVMEIASISGTTLTFTTKFPITHPTSQSAHLYRLNNAVKYSGIEDLYLYGGEGGDGGGGVHLWNCAYCWVKHVEASYNSEPINIDTSFRAEVRDSFIHDAQGGLHNSTASYGIAVNWYTSQSLFENNVVLRFNKPDVMRSAGGGNVFGYNYVDDGADLGGGWFETNLNSSHMTTPHYELFEGNESANFDQDDRWGNSAYITIFRNHLIGQLRDFPSSGPKRAAGLTQWHWWQSFVGNVLGNPSHPGITGYEGLGASQPRGGNMWMMCWQNNDNTPDGGKCLSTQLRDGNFDYVTGKVHWHGIGGSGADNGLTTPANSTLPASMYLSAKPAFFGSNPWPWVNGSNANPLPGQLPARERYDAGTPNAAH